MSAILFGVFFIGLFVGLPCPSAWAFRHGRGPGDGRFMGMVCPVPLQRHQLISLMAVPFFILAAEIMSASGLTNSLMKFANDLVGHIAGAGSCQRAHEHAFCRCERLGPGGCRRARRDRDEHDAQGRIRRPLRGALSAATATIGPSSLPAS